MAPVDAGGRKEDKPAIESLGGSVQAQARPRRRTGAGILKVDSLRSDTTDDAVSLPNFSPAPQDFPKPTNVEKPTDIENGSSASSKAKFKSLFRVRRPKHRNNPRGEDSIHSVGSALDGSQGRRSREMRGLVTIGTDLSDEHTDDARRSQSAPCRSIMTVRTLDDSLSGIDRRRAATRRALRNHKHLKKDGGTLVLQKLADDLRSGSQPKNPSDSPPVGSDPAHSHRRFVSFDDLETLKVSFSKVEIREYPIIIGDNPSVSNGAPLTIAWEPQDQVSAALDEYENNRPPRRAYTEMSMPKIVREDMIRSAGISRGEIRRVTRDVNIARRQRRKTIELLHTATFEETMERAKRGIKNIIMKSKKHKERVFIENAFELDLLAKKTRNTIVGFAESQDALRFQKLELEASTPSVGVELGGISEMVDGETEDSHRATSMNNDGPK